MIVIPKGNNDIKGIIRSNRRIKVNADAKYVSGRHPNNVFNDELSDKWWYGAPRNDQNITITFKNVKNNSFELQHSISIKKLLWLLSAKMDIAQIPRQPMGPIV